MRTAETRPCLLTENERLEFMESIERAMAMREAENPPCLLTENQRLEFVEAIELAGFKRVEELPAPTPETT